MPASQQPYRAVLDPRESNALLEPVKDNQAPPHNVRLKPLLEKTRKKEEEKAKGVSGQNSSERTKGQQKKKMWGGRTVAHVRHRRRVPLGKI